MSATKLKVFDALTVLVLVIFNPQFNAGVQRPIESGEQQCLR